MNDQKPELTRDLDSKTFREFYYLKEELVTFCRIYGLQAMGSKEDLIERISVFLDTGERIGKNYEKPKTVSPNSITLDSIIEPNFVCSEKHREFFKEEIGQSFTFKVAFQKWLKENTGKTYGEAVKAYYGILADRQTNTSEIGGQFEFNQYIRDFFEDNKHLKREDAIKCWNYKKNLRGSHKYEKFDLEILRSDEDE